MGPTGEKAQGIYSSILTESIGKGAYAQCMHGNVGFLRARVLVPYPKAMQYAWSHTRFDAAHNHGIDLLSPTEKWSRLGPSVSETPSDVKNKGATEKKRRNGSKNKDPLGKR
jgi:hypothetical protein